MATAAVVAVVVATATAMVIAIEAVTMRGSVKVARGK